MCFKDFLHVLVQMLFAKKLDITKSNIFVSPALESQNVTQGSEIGHDWIQNILSFPFLFFENLLQLESK